MLVFQQNNMAGSIPTELGRLTKLVTLELSINDQFRGAVPSELGLLTELVGLGFRNQIQITGTVPTEIGLLTKLEFLGLHFTGLTGDFPANLCIANPKPNRLIIDCSDMACPSQCCRTGDEAVEYPSFC